MPTMGLGAEDNKDEQICGLREEPQISKFCLVGFHQRGEEFQLFLCYTAQVTQVLNPPDLWAQMEHTSWCKDVEESGQGNCPLPELGRAENPLAPQGFQKELLGLSCSRACPERIPPINLLRINPNPPPHFHCHPRLDLHDPTPR